MDVRVTTIPSWILEYVYRHYPRETSTDDQAHEATQETRRLREAQSEARRDRSRLIALLEAFEKNLPGVRALDLSYLSYDACYIARVNADPVGTNTVRWRELVPCISIIAPFYFMYQSLIEIQVSGERKTSVSFGPDTDLANFWRDVARLVEQIFGYTAIGPEVGLKVVSNVQIQNVPLGSATLYDCLFTPSRE